MGKHAAPKQGRRSRASAPPAATRTAGTRTSAVERPEPTPTPAALRQAAGFGALAVVVAVVALLWAGAGARTAFAVGAGLLLIGGAAFLVVRRTRLLDEGATADPAAAPPTHP